MNPHLAKLVFALVLLSCISAEAQDRKTKVLNDRDTFEKNDLWIYNDIGHAFDAAKKGNKPLLVVFRCVPCEACSHFDQQLLAEQEQMKDLLDQFVCARIVQANGLDLELFQFGYDQSFHAMFLNADKTIYGRYGTRSYKKEDEDMTMAGFRAAMQRVLELHKAYPENKKTLAGKRGGPVKFAVPEQFPSLKGKYKGEIDYEGNVVQSCIHCHQVRDAERDVVRKAGGEMPEQVLFPYPLPETIGLTMDPSQCATVKAVDAESELAEAFRPGDKILSLQDQPIVSTADIQWVLHNLQDDEKLHVTIERNGKKVQSVIALPEGWRRAGSLSWRPTTWDLRRIATGGMLLVGLTEQERKARGLPADSMALRIKHLGQYGEHAVAKNAGFQQEDVLVKVGKETANWSETDFIAAAIKNPRGSQIEIEVLRGEKRLPLKLPLQ